MTNISQALVPYQDLQLQQDPKWIWHLHMLHAHLHVLYFIQESVNMKTIIYIVV